MCRKSRKEKLPASGFGLVLAAVLTAISCGRTMADDIGFQFSEAGAGVTPVSTVHPWISAMFENEGNGVVRLTISNDNLVAAENLDKFEFNLNSQLKLSSLQLRVVGGSGGFDLPKFSKNRDRFYVPGDGNYDLQLSFASGSGVRDRFGKNEYVVCELYGIRNLSADDFSFLSTAGHNADAPMYTAAHIQRIGDDLASGWINCCTVTPITVPEPGIASMLILGAGCLCRRKRG